MKTTFGFRASAFATVALLAISVLTATAPASAEEDLPAPPTAQVLVDHAPLVEDTSADGEPEVTAPVASDTPIAEPAPSPTVALPEENADVDPIGSDEPSDVTGDKAPESSAPPEAKGIQPQDTVNGASVSGHVTFPDAVDPGADGTEIIAYTSADYAWAASSWVQPDGSYSIENLEAGTYKIEFFPYNQDLHGQWWQSADSFDDATTVTVDAGDTLTGIDALLRDASAVLMPATPAVSGTAKVGSKLTAVPGEWSPMPSFSYQWFADGEPIANATGAMFTPLVTELDKAITVEVTGMLSGYQSVSAMSPATAQVVGATLTSATPTISGTAKNGQTLTVAVGTWTSGTSFTYAWYANGAVISGANKSTYTLTASSVGKTITVNVTGDRAGFITTSKTSAATAKVVGVTLTSATPTISGTPKFGQTVTAKTGTWTSGANLTYQWYASGAAISDATKSSYKITAQSVGKTIQVKVTGTKAGYVTEVKTSASTAKVVGEKLTSATPTISGTAKHDQTLTAKPGTWTSGTTLTYQWYAGGTAIKGGTKATHKLTATSVGKAITVKVTGTKTGYVTVTTTSKATAKVVNATLKAGTPKISGSVSVGSKLSVVKGTWTTGTTFTYQWYRNGSKISAATASTYKLTSADSGKEISVKVTGSKAGYDKVTKSAATKWALATAAPKITGSAIVGQTLTAAPGKWTSGTTFTYQWYSNGVAISKAKSSTYKLAAADVGKQISVKITGNKSGYDTASKTSGKTKSIAKATLKVSKPVISGSENAGRTLTAKPGTWTTGTSFTYQWYRGGSAIPGATASTYTSGGQDASKSITVKVTGSKAGYVSASQTSAATVVKMTATQMRAVDLANRYLNYFSFSRAGLIDQLEYEGYSTSDASVAVDYVSPNWKSQAIASAESYLSYTSFSRQGLIDQLLYEGFTQTEATYGVDALNADWNEQARLEALSYLRIFSYWSYSELFDQLIYEGFTASQASYGATAAYYQ